MVEAMDEMELLASVNPEPDVSGNPWDDEVLVREPAQSRRRRWPMWAVAAAIAVVVVAVGSSGDEGPSRVVTGGTPPTTTAAASPVGEEIRVTPDSVQLGAGLDGMNIAEEDGHLYVLAGRGPANQMSNSEEAVLAAFDDAGNELWRTRLDGGPADPVVTGGDLWVFRQGGLSRIDASDGRLLGNVPPIERMTGWVAAFGSVWVGALEPSGPGRLVRIERDLSTTSFEIPLFEGAGLQIPRAGAGAVWMPLQGRGVAVIDPETNGVTVMPVDDIGHAVLDVAFDGDVAYVTDYRQVTSIVDGEVLATASPGAFSYLGPMDGVFGVQLQVDFEASTQFVVLRANDPMVVAIRQIAVPEQAAARLAELAGDAWMSMSTATGRNYGLRRVELLPVSAGDRE